MAGPFPAKKSASLEPVVTVFLWDGERILLSQRSDQVSTFPGHWAGISGYLEGTDPVVRGLWEVEEEVGISAADVFPLCQGGVLDVPVRGGSVYRVHPYLFRMRRMPPLIPNWESRCLTWVSPAELLAGRIAPTVPGLSEALQRVWPPPTSQASLELALSAAVSWLRADRRHGSLSLARAAVRLWRNLVESCADDLEGHREWLRTAASLIASARPVMAAPANLLGRVLPTFEHCRDTNSILGAVDAAIAESEAAESRAVRRAATLLPTQARVLTTSYSGMVEGVLRRAREKLDTVLISEGRPLMEGRRLAEHLAAEGTRVTVLTEAQLLLVASHVDVVLVGADTVLPDGSIVNKVGTGLAALAARQFDKPVWCVATRLKQAAHMPPPGTLSERNPAEEVWPDRPQGVMVVNEYFEVLPARYVAALILEDE